MTDDALLLKAIEVDADTIWIRPGHIERFDAALSTKQVPRNTGIEAVFGQVLCSGQQSKTRFVDNQVQKTRHSADRTIAIVENERRRCIHLKRDCATVTTPTMGHVLV